MVIHFRKDFEELNQEQLSLAKLTISDYLEPTHSYLSMVELGLYESTSKVYSSLSHVPRWHALPICARWIRLGRRIRLGFNRIRCWVESATSIFSPKISKV